METTIINEKKVCSACKWAASNPGGQLECRKKGPTALAIQRQSPLGGQPEMQIATVFPPIKHDLWCGDFQPTSLIEH
jgi:hypothetical protein